MRAEPVTCGVGRRNPLRRTGWRDTAFLAGALVIVACADPDTREPDADPPAVDEHDGEGSEEDLPSVESPDPEPDPGDDAEESREQRRAADLPTPRTEVTGTVWDGRIVAVGGLDSDGAALAVVDLYDPDTDTWEAGPALPVALHHTAVATLGDRVYVVGGYSIQDGAWVAEVAVWSLGPGEQAWVEEPPLTIPRGALAVASTGQRLVALGGVDPAGQVLTSTEVLDVGAEAWEPGPELGTAREHLDATAVGDEVYAIAGRAGGLDTNHASAEVLRGGEWVEEPLLQTSRGGIGAATVDGVPCVVGGEEPAGTIGTIECLVDDAWQVLGELEVPRHGLVVASIDGELHVVGGGPEPGLTISGVHEVIPIDLP